MKRGWLIAGLGGAILLTGIGAWVIPRLGTREIMAMPGPILERIIARAVVVPAQGIAEVKSQVDGRVLAVYVREGERVEAGQLLAEIDGATLEAEVSRRESERKALDAVERSIQEGARPAEREALEADVHAAEAELRFAETEVDRQIRLEKTGSSTQSLTREAQHRVELAKARLEVARARSRLARSSRSADREAARERASAAAAAVAQARSELSRTRVIAPISGVVLSRRVDPGDTVAKLMGGQSTSLFEIAEVSRIELKAEVEEHDANRRLDGLSVTIVLPGEADAQTAPAQVLRASPKLERRSIGADDARLRADAWVRVVWVGWTDGASSPNWPVGLKLEAHIELPARHVDTRLPREAVHIRHGRIYVVEQGPLLEKHDVELGSADADYVEVRGIAPGTRVILE